MADVTLEALSDEDRTFPPPPGFVAGALVTDDTMRRDADADPEAFWAAQARSLLHWDADFTTTCEWELPFAKWFTGGRLNVSYNCLDRHVAAGHGDQVAILWEGEPGDARSISYGELLAEVGRTANALKELGVERGDRVAIYMGMVPELPIAMLACARIGAAHSVVFGGFTADSLRDRINDAEARVLVTGDGAWRRGGIVPLKQIADEALTETPSIEQCLVLRRTEQDVAMTDGRDVWWHDVVPAPVARVRARVDGCRGPALHPLHQRHHRQAQGHHAHDRRLPHPGGVHHEVRVRSPPRDRRVLVHRRLRLGDRPLVHRVRPAREPRHERDVRGHARPPGQGPVLVDRREVRRVDPLHRAHRDPDLHEVGHRVHLGPRPLVTPAARIRRASPSTPRRGSGTRITSVATAARWSTRGGRPRPARS